MADWMGDDHQPPARSGWKEPASSRSCHPSHLPFQGPAGCANLSISEDAYRSHARSQYLLNKTLGPEQIASRSGGAGTKLSYLEGWRAINIANDVFGYNGWYTEIKYLEADFVDYNAESGRYNIGVTAIVRVRLEDGGSHEDIGYGKIENTKSKGDGLDKCKKEAVTDALKRALRHFGKLLGNCLYDKAYLEGIQKMKAPKPKFDFASMYKPDIDNVPITDPNAPWLHASTSTSMPAPPPPAAAAGPPPPAGNSKPAPHPPHMSAHLNRSKTLPTGGTAPPPHPQAGKPTPRAPGTVGTSLPPHLQRAAIVATPSRPNPLDRSGASTVALDNPIEERILAEMELDVEPTMGGGAGGGGGETSFMSDGDLSTSTNGTGRVYFEGDSGYGEVEDLSAIKDSPFRQPPGGGAHGSHHQQNGSGGGGAGGGGAGGGGNRLTPAQQRAAAQARLAENQAKKKQGGAVGAAVNGVQQASRRSSSADPSPPATNANAAAVAAVPRAGAATSTAAHLARHASTTTPSLPLPVPALGSAKPPGLRPVHPPSRTTSLQHDHSSHSRPISPAVPALGAMARTTSILAAGGLAGVSAMANASPEKARAAGVTEGEGFRSARGVKRGHGEGYDPSPPLSSHSRQQQHQQHQQHQQQQQQRTPGSSGTLAGQHSGDRHPLGELPVDQSSGAVKRSRA